MFFFYYDEIRYLMTMENSRDIEDFCNQLLDLSNPEHRKFVELLLGKLGHSFDHAVVPDKSKDTGKIRKEKLIKFVNQPDSIGENVQQQQQQSSKKKVKQVSLFSKEGQARESVTLPGQHR